MVTPKIVMVSIVVACLISAANAAEILVAVDDWPPFQHEKNGKMIGPIIEISQAVANRAGVDIAIKTYPWARVYHMGLTKENVLVSALMRTHDREELFRWVETVYTAKNFLYKLRKRTDIRIGRLEEAMGYTIGGVRKGAEAEYLKSKGLTIEFVKLLTQNIKKLEAGRIQLFVADEVNFTHSLKTLGFDPSDFEKAYYLKNLSQKSHWMAFSRATSDDVAEKFQEALEEIKKEGIFDEIWNKYLQ